MGAGLRRRGRGGALPPPLLDARAHWLLLCRPALAALGALGTAAAVVVGFPGAPGWVGLLLAAVLALVLVPVVARAVRVRATRVLVDAGRVVLESGVVRRRRRVLPLRGVTEVTLRQGPLERLVGAGVVGLCALGGSEIELPLLGRARALQDLLEVLSGAPGPAAAEDGTDPVPAAAPPLEPAWLDDLRRRGVLTNAEWAAAREHASRPRS